MSESRLASKKQWRATSLPCMPLFRHQKHPWLLSPFASQ